MITAQSIVADLKCKGKEKTRITYARHGMALDRTLGVSVADLKVIAKTIKKQQALAMDLYETGYMEAMYLAGIVANGAHMSREQLQSWAEQASSMTMISEYTVPWVTVENPRARAIATEWIQSKQEHVASAGWCTWSGLVATRPDAELDLPRLEALLDEVVANIGEAKNRVRYTMNGFVISVGAYVEPLLAKAKAAAERIGNVSVDVGDTACEVPVAAASIEKIERLGRVGTKRKTIRC